MKFIFADSLDMVDPNFDFINERFAKGREVYWDDYYPHEMLGSAPYDGMLVSRGIVGDMAVAGKYSSPQAMRFKREGARAFLRLDKPELKDMSIFGDCGAFTYVKHDVPPYTPADTVEFYDTCGFTHGCSVDHIIFDFDDSLLGLAGGSPEARRRFDITLANAEHFLKEVKQARPIRPLGVVQGWSPTSMAQAARRLVKHCLRAIRDAIPATTEIHVLGFAKADDIHEFLPFNISSFDTTSPLIRAFKDARANYWLANDSGKLDYFTAIRIPQSLENPRLMRMVKQGQAVTETLVDLEASALASLRAYEKKQKSLDDCLQSVLAYSAIFSMGQPLSEVIDAPTMVTLKARYHETLSARPWERCGCRICKQSGIEVVLFRGSNRNKRRGMHNLSVFNAVVQNLSNQQGARA